MIKQLLGALVVSICVISLSFHFVVEGLGGVQDHMASHQVAGALHSHEGDQFLLSETESASTAQTFFPIPFLSNLNQISRPVPPPFHPPKAF